MTAPRRIAVHGPASPAASCAASLALLVVASVVASVAAPPLRAQEPAAAARSAPSLAELHRLATERDARAQGITLQRAQSALRELTIRTERQRPVLAAEGLGQYQSDVPSLPIALPTGGTAPGPAHDSWDVRLNARQRLFDATVAPRLALERAQLAESESRLEVALFGVREAVTEAYFSALQLGAQAHELTLATTVLEEQLRGARERVAAGTALPSEADALEAEILRRRQAIAEVGSRRATALRILGDLTGVTLGPDDTLDLPALDAAVDAARARTDSLRARPEFAHFARARDALAAQERVVGARELPRVSAFGRVGYGRPGLNVLGDEFDAYWLAGVQVEWMPWTWGSARREREVLALQRRLVTTEEEAFADAVGRSALRDLGAIDHLQGLRAGDDAIIALRQRILDETAHRYREQVVPAAEYVARQTDLLLARLAAADHRMELARAQARLLTTLGLEAH